MDEQGEHFSPHMELSDKELIVALERDAGRLVSMMVPLETTHRNERARVLGWPTFDGKVDNTLTEICRYLPIRKKIAEIKFYVLDSIMPHPTGDLRHRVWIYHPSTGIAIHGEIADRNISYDSELHEQILRGDRLSSEDEEYGREILEEMYDIIKSGLPFRGGENF